MPFWNRFSQKERSNDKKQYKHKESQSQADGMDALDADLAEANRLLELRRHDARANQPLIRLCERLIAQLSREEEPRLYASLQLNLGLSYADLPTGDGVANLQQAIIYYQEALRVFTPEATPTEYAITLYNLGMAYKSLRTGDRASNLKQAIACYREALRVYTLDAAPDNYAKTHISLGIAYKNLQTGDRASNLGQAIACYREALRVYTLDAAPDDYALAQANLAIAYAQLPMDDQATNIQQAIACYREALRVYTLDAAPDDYALTLNNLGLSYAKLPTGDQTANLNLAIACYQEALRVRTPETAPDDYAMTQDNLGNAYWKLPGSDRAIAIQQAIACYQEALRVYTLKAAPDDYARVQSKLGNAYVEFPTEDRANHLKQAIICYREALRVYTLKAAPDDYARVQSKLGNAYVELPTGDRANHLKQAIICYREALRVYTPQTALYEYVETQANLGIASKSLSMAETQGDLGIVSSLSIEELFETIMAFISAETWEASQRIVEQHPELLIPEIDAVIQAVAGTQENEQMLRILETHRTLLARCRAVGVPQAFAQRSHQDNRSLDDNRRSEGRFSVQEKLAEANRLSTLKQENPHLIKPLIQLCEQLLDEIDSDENAALRAQIQYNLGVDYMDLPDGDRTANIQRAIACYQEALRFFTPESAPQEYIQTQTNLGIAYRDLPSGDHTANLQQAIACYQEALRLLKPEAAPLDYARTQNILGNAYHALSSGDPTTNIQRAIACYHEALRFRTPEAAPLDYAHTQHILGLAYTALPIGDRTANFRQAIAYYHEALRFFTPEAAPQKHAETQMSLGIAYTELPSGDRTANLQQAIACYSEALRFQTPETAPMDYARIHANLAVAYQNLPSGDLTANFQQAMASYREALRFWTPEAAPMEYARLYTNMGGAYQNLPPGDRTANLQQALACYNEALRFFTPEAAPRDYARTKARQGNAYRELSEGVFDIPLAMGCYAEALRFFTPEAAPMEYAGVQYDEGWAHLERRALDRTPNIQKAIVCFQNALRYVTPETAPGNYAGIQMALGTAYQDLSADDRSTNLQQAIACYQEALRFDTPEIAPQSYALAQFNLGTLYEELPSDDHAADLQQALDCYQEALRFFTLEIDPVRCRRTNHVLADLYFRQSHWSAALAAYQVAISAGELLYRMSVSSRNKAKEVVQNTSLYRKAAFAAARLGDPAQALLFLERGKTRLLADALHIQVPRPMGVPDAAWDRFTAAGQALRDQTMLLLTDEKGSMEIMYEVVRYGVHGYASRFQQAQVASTELAEAVEQVRVFAPTFQQPLTFATVRSLVPDPQTALLTFCLTEQGCLGLVLCHGADAPVQSVELPYFSTKTLSALIHGSRAQPELDSWLDTYRQDRVRWQKTMDQVLATIGEQVLAPMLTSLPPDVTKLILLPSDALFILPLHAAPLPGNDGQRLCDRYEVRYAPSAEVLANCQEKVSQRTGDTLFAVINPTEDPNLAFTPSEGKAITRLFDAPHVLVGAKGHEEAVRAQIAGHTYIHFSCHGTYVWQDAQESGLDLAGGACLTLAELQKGAVDLSAARLVSLSACETGVSDIYGHTEEYVGLSAAFLAAGVPCVISSLWTVPDLSAALIMEQFYALHRREGLEPASALRAAQAWVRNLPIAQVVAYAQQAYQQAEPVYKPTLLAYLRRYRHLAQKDPALRPFEHPYFWAAFTVNGV